MYRLLVIHKQLTYVIYLEVEDKTSVSLKILSFYDQTSDFVLKNDDNGFSSIGFTKMLQKF